MLERQIEAAVCKYAKDEGCIVIKLNGPGDRGKPDRLILRDGKSLFVEFKRPGGRMSALQEKWQRDLREKGFTCETIDTVADGVRLVHGFFGL